LVDAKTWDAEPTWVAATPWLAITSKTWLATTCKLKHRQPAVVVQPAGTTWEDAMPTTWEAVATCQATRAAMAMEMLVAAVEVATTWVDTRTWEGVMDVQGMETQAAWVTTQPWVAVAT